MGELRKLARQTRPYEDLDEGQVVPVGVPARLQWPEQKGATRQLFAYRRGGTFLEGGMLRGQEVSGTGFGPKRWPARLREFRLDAFFPPVEDGAVWTKVRTYHRLHRRGVSRMLAELGAPCGVIATPGEDWAGPHPSWLVADPVDHVVRELFRSPDPAGGYVGRVWGRPGDPGGEDGAEPRLNRPTWLAAAPDPETGRIRVVLADSGNHALRLLHADGSVTTFAGEQGAPGWRDGQAVAGTRFNTPEGVAFDPSGHLWVADRGNRVIRRIARDGTVRTVAGSGAGGCQDGRGRDASFTLPKGIAAAGGRIFVTDGHGLRMIDPELNVSTPLGVVARPGCASAGPSAPCLDDPQGLAFDGTDLVIADRGNHCLRLFRPDTGESSILAGDRALPDFRPGLLRDGLPAPLPRECAALGRPMGLCCGTGRDLVLTADGALVDLGRAADRVAPGPGRPFPITVAPAPRTGESKGGRAAIQAGCLPHLLSWDMDLLSRQRQKPGEDGFRDAWCTIECRGADGQLESINQGPLPVTRGRAELLFDLREPGIKRVLLRILTRQGVHLWSEQAVLPRAADQAGP